MSVLIDKPALHVCRIRINRPAKRNAIDYAVRQGAELAEGYSAVVAADQPGFLVNHAGRGLYKVGPPVAARARELVARHQSLSRQAPPTS